MTAVELSSLTSAQAEALVRNEAPVAGLIATGAVEQHGPHLPLGTDCFIAEYLARRVAEQVPGRVVITPTIYGGLSTHHVKFAGTVDLPRQVFEGFIEAQIKTLAGMGITRVALFSAHGGNFAAIAEIANDHDERDGLRVVAYDDVERFLELMRNAASSRGLEVTETDSHAGALETSQMLHIHGESRIAATELEGYVEAEEGWLDRMIEEGIGALSPIGILGRTHGATAKAGEAICDALADELSRWMTEALSLA